MQEDGTHISNIKIAPENFAEFISLIHRDVLSSKGAQGVLRNMYETGNDPSHIVEKEDFAQMSNFDDLEGVVRQVIKANPGPAQDYKNGKGSALQFLIGQAMKETKGKANPQLVGELLEKALR